MKSRFFTKTLSASVVLLAFFSQINFAKAQQTLILNENFDNHIPGSFIQPGWSSNPVADTSSWHTDSSANNSSSGYTGASGEYHMLIRNTDATGIYILTSPAFSTIGYDTVSFLWAARSSNNFNASGSTIQKVEWSFDGSNWDSLTFNDNASNGNWDWENHGNRMTLPPSAIHLPTVYIRWVMSIVHDPQGTYRIDDFNVTGHLDGTGVSTIPSSKNNYLIFVQGKNIFIENRNSDEINYCIYNLSGQLLISEFSSQPEIKISGSFIPEGFHLVTVEDKKHTIICSNKVVIR